MVKGMRRRYFLSSAAALGAATVAPAFGQQKPVFLHYTQEQLDQAYDQAVWAPQLKELQAYDSASSAAVRKVLPPRTERYGKSDIELIDIFTPANTSGVPVMIEQCRSAVEWAVHNAASFGGDPNRVYISGHSSGSHLASCVLITDWTKRGLPADTIKGAVPMSGMYELYPAMLSSRGKYVQITPQEMDAASAMRHLRMVNCPVVVANGDRDSPEFRHQSTVLADALQGMGRLDARIELLGTNHFQVPQLLSKPDSELSQLLYALMKN